MADNDRKEPLDPWEIARGAIEAALLAPRPPASVARSPSETIPSWFVRLITGTRRICFRFISSAASRTSWSS